MTVSQWFSLAADKASLRRIDSTIFMLLLAFTAAPESHAAAARPLRIV